MYEKTRNVSKYGRESFDDIDLQGNRDKERLMVTNRNGADMVLTWDGKKAMRQERGQGDLGGNFCLMVVYCYIPYLLMNG